MIAGTGLDSSNIDKRQGFGWAIILACITLAICFGETRLAERLNGLWFNSRTAFLRTWRPEKMPNEVVLIAFDNTSLRDWPEPLTLWHFHFAELLDSIRQAKPRLVVFDIGFCRDNAMGESALSRQNLRECKSSRAAR